MHHGEERPWCGACDLGAPVSEAPARSTGMGTFMPSTMPDLRGRENLGTFLKRFRTWTCINRCASALDLEIAVNTSEIPRVELERLHDYNPVDNSLKALQALTKALKKEREITEIVIEIGSLRSMVEAL